MELKWIHVEGNPWINYAKIRGGWLVQLGETGGDNVAFIPDPDHENPPEPMP